jgi:hypothetical protein
MMNFCCRAVGPVVLLCMLTASLSSQTLVVPRGMATDLGKTEGNSSFHLPGTWAPSRVACIYRMRDMALPVTGRKIQGLALRRDGLKTSTYKTHKWKLTVRLSSQGVDRPGLAVGESFAALHGSDESVVVNARLVVWPSMPRPKPGTGPSPFVPLVKFDKPFVLSKGRDLCVDMLSEEPTKQRAYAYWYADAEAFDERKTRGTATAYGKACPVSFKVAGISPPLDGERPLRIRGLTGMTSKSGVGGLLWLGVNKTKYRALSLPFEMSSLGAPGCRLYVAPLFTMATRSLPGDRLGELRFDLPIPGGNTALVGMRLYAQVFADDPQHNKLGLRVSRYLSIKLGQVGKPLPARLFYHSGPTLSDRPSAARDMGLVLRLD